MRKNLRIPSCSFATRWSRNLQGYSRKDTVDYYRKIVAQAWTQVEQAGTVELASNAYDEQLLWLMLDPNQRARTETVFRDRVIQPNPLWFWWWYGYTIYHPHPMYTPNINAPAQSGPPPADSRCRLRKQHRHIS